MNELYMNELDMNELDINSKIIKVLLLPASDIHRMKNVYITEDNFYWKNFECYATWVREGKKSSKDYGIPPDFLGTATNLEERFYKEIKWCCEKIITPESDPEYYI